MSSIVWARNDAPGLTNYYFYDVVWAEELAKFCAVGIRTSGSLFGSATSLDGVTWSPVATATATSTAGYSVAWSSSLLLFVAVDGTTPWHSADGVSWTQGSFPAASPQTRAVAWSPTLGMFVAVPYSGGRNILTSTDGVNWTKVVNALPAPANLYYDIIWADTQFIAFAFAGGLPNLVTSPDGTTWTAQSAPAANYSFQGTQGGQGRSAAFSSDLAKTIACGLSGSANHIIESANGSSWTVHDPPDPPYITPGGLVTGVVSVPTIGPLVVEGALSDTIWFSADGLTWVAETLYGDTPALFWGAGAASPSLGVVVFFEASNSPRTLHGTYTPGFNPTPTGLVATAQPDGCVDLTWTDNSDGWLTDQETGTAQVTVAIYRKDSPDGYYSFLAYAPAAGPYTDCSVFPDLNYAYRVQAMKTGAQGEPLLDLHSSPWSSVTVDNIIFFYYLGQPIYGLLPSGGTFVIGSGFVPAPPIAPPRVTELSDLSNEDTVLTYPPVPTITDAAFDSETGFLTIDWEALRIGPPQNQGTITYTVKRTLTSGSGYSTLASGIADDAGLGTYDDAGFTFDVPNYYIVIATNATGDSAASTEFAVTPSAVTEVIPAFGCGSTPIAIIDGAGRFLAGDTVKVGGVSATSVVVVSKNRITCVTGAHADGLVNVVVTHTDTTTITFTGAFTYGTPWWKRTLEVLLDGQTFIFEQWVNQCTAPAFGVWDLGNLVDPRLWWHYPPLNYYIFQETNPGGWVLGAPVSNDGWFSSTAEFGGSISVIDGGVPAKPRKWSDISVWAASGAAMLGGSPAASAGIDNRIVYPATGYTVGTDYPPIRIFDGTFDHEIARLPPTTSNTVPQAVLAMLAANGTVYLTTFDSGTSSADWRGRVFQLDHQNGELTPLGTNFAAGEMPYTLAWHMGRLWCGTNNGIGTVGKVYYFRPGIDTAWTLDHSLATESLGGVDSMMSYKGKLYVGSDNQAGSRGKVLQRDTVGAYTVVETGSGGTARVNNGYLSMTVFQDNLYTAYWNNDTTAVAYIRKFDGTTWSTAFTGATTTLKPYIVLFHEDDTLFALGGGLLLPAAILRTPDGTTWTNLSSFLPDATHTLLPIYGVEIL